LQEVFGAPHPAFEMQRRDVFLSALQTYLTCSADFADCLILTESALAGHELATFDRKLGKLAGARLLAPAGLLATWNPFRPSRHPPLP
jgi:hypothetical protein